MSRIPYFEINQNDENSEFYNKLPKLNLFRMLAHTGTIGQSFIKLGSSILLKGKLDPVLREIAIIRTGILCGSVYEVHQHKKIAHRIGMTEEKTDSIETGPVSEHLSDLEKLVVRFTDEIVKNIKSSDKLFHELLLSLDYSTVSELVITIGYYMMVSTFLENFEVDIEE